MLWLSTPRRWELTTSRLRRPLLVVRRRPLRPQPEVTGGCLKFRQFGSVQESGKPRVFRGFWTSVKLARRSSSRSGNVETRVLCGFPSSGGPGMNSSAEHHQSVPGASFPQRGPSFSGDWRLLDVSGHLRPRCAPLRKPHNMHVLTNSRSEPAIHYPRNS